MPGRCGDIGPHLRLPEAPTAPLRAGRGPGQASLRVLMGTAVRCRSAHQSQGGSRAPETPMRVRHGRWSRRQRTRVSVKRGGRRYPGSRKNLEPGNAGAPPLAWLTVTTALLPVLFRGSASPRHLWMREPRLACPSSGWRMGRAGSFQSRLKCRTRLLRLPGWGRGLLWQQSGFWCSTPSI